MLHREIAETNYFYMDHFRTVSHYQRAITMKSLPWWLLLATLTRHWYLIIYQILAEFPVPCRFSFLCSNSSVGQTLNSLKRENHRRLHLSHQQLWFCSETSFCQLSFSILLRAVGLLIAFKVQDLRPSLRARQVQIWRRSFDIPPPALEKAHQKSMDGGDWWWKIVTLRQSKCQYKIAHYLWVNFPN